MTTTSTISTGTVSTSGSTTYISGASSGIDTDALVQAGYEAKLTVADKIDVKISENEAIIAAYEDLQSLATSLTTALSDLKTTYGYSLTDGSVYNSKASYLGASDGSTVSNYMSVEVGDDAQQASYAVQIKQIATAAKVKSDTQTSKTDSLGLEGSFTLNLDGKSAISIAVTSDMSLQDVTDAINQLSSSTGVKASIIKSGDSGYILSLGGSETGLNMVYASESGADILNQLGVTNADGSFKNVTQTAQSSIITIDGTEVTSTSNTIEDVLDGVSVTLYSAPTSTDTIFTMEVDYDYSATKDAIQSFIDAYNDLRDYFKTQQTTNSDGTAADSSVLFNDTLLKTLSNSLYSLVTDSFGNSDTLSTLADMGITLDSSNNLQISDETLLNDMLLNNYTDVQALFQTSVSMDSDDLQVLRNNSTFDSLDFSLDITMNEDGTIASASVGGDSSLFTVSGTRILGAEGTAYEGLVLVYVGSESQSIHVDMKQGLADRMYNLLDNYTSTTDGIIQDKVTRLSNLDDALQTKSDRIKERAESYRDKLVEKYAAMETAIASAKSLLKQVQALLGTDSSD